MYKSELSGNPVQVAVGYAGDYYGIEGGYSFYYSSSIMRSWQAIIGTSRIEDERRYLIADSEPLRWDYEDENWTYVGVSGTFRLGGFYVEPGISVGTGDHSNPQLTLQVGWLWSL